MQNPDHLCRQHYWPSGSIGNVIFDIGGVSNQTDRLVFVIANEHQDRQVNQIPLVNLSNYKSKSVNPSQQRRRSFPAKNILYIDPPCDFPIRMVLPMKKIYLLLLLTPSSLVAQNADIVLPDGWDGDPPALLSLVTFAQGESDLRVAIVRYLEDKAAIERRYEVNYSPARIGRLTEFLLGWQKNLQALSFDDLNHEGQIDYIALRNRIDFDLENLRLEEERGQEIKALLPFADSLRLLQEDRHDRKRVHPRTAAGTLNAVTNDINALIDDLAAQDNAARDRQAVVSPVVAWRAARQIEHLREVLADWYTFYNGYDPMLHLLL